MLVLWVLPLWPDSFLKEVVVCLEAQFGGRCDVVLVGKNSVSDSSIVPRGKCKIERKAYVDSPELLH